MANLEALVPLGGGMKLLDRQVFTGSGTWTKPADYAGNVAAGAGKLWLARVIGSGASGSGGSVASPGAGGPGGGYTIDWGAISLAGATETVTVGASVAGALGVVGLPGNPSSFGALVVAGGGGAPDTAAPGSSEALPMGGTGTYPGGGVTYVIPNGTALSAPGSFSTGGGGAGGGATATSGSKGGDGTTALGGAGGVTGATGANGTAGTNSTKNGPGGGGGGGGRGSAGNGGTGGAGGNYGGGGGGGGRGSVAGGAGGASGPGIVVVEVWG